MVKLSIVIPSYNEEGDIADVIESLQKQSFKDFEIIIVDDGSTDSTREIVKKYSKKFKNVRLFSTDHQGPGNARNVGVQNSKGEVLVFVDSDMTFDKNYLKNLTSAILKDKKVIGTTHDTEIVTNVDNIWSKCWGKIRVSKEDAHKVKIFRAIRKSKFVEMGRFDPKYGYADDQTFWFKHGIKPIVANNSICYHKNPEELKAVYKQSRWIGASIDNKLFRMSVIKYFVPIFLVLLSPILIPLLSIKKSHKIRNFRVLLPWMLIFTAVRYFGSVEGIYRNIYFGKNFR